MAIFLADRRDIQTRQLHRRIANRFKTDGSFESVQRRVTEPREPGPYLVVARTDPRVFLDDAAYPVTTARIEVGFELRGGADQSWFNWIEPEREFLLGWHHAGDHPDLGPVHLQVNHAGAPVVQVPATFVDAHPMAVLEARLDQVTETLARVRWQDGIVTGIERGT